MISFKEYLEEAITKKPQTTKVNVVEAIKFLNAHCKDGLKAISNGGLLYRGAGSSVDTNKTWSIIDTSQYQRTSKDSNNVYQLLMDVSPALSAYPKRSNSLICSTYDGTAAAYGTPYVMIPLDGTDIAVSPTSDIFSLAVIAPPVSEIDMQTLSDRLGSVFTMVGAKQPRSPQFEDAKKINLLMSQFTPTELAIITLRGLLFLKTLGYIKNDKFSAATVESAVKQLANTLTVTSQPINKVSLRSLKTVVSAYNGGHVQREDNMDKLIEIYSKNPSNKLIALANFLMSPRTTKLKLVKFGDKLPVNVEAWFSGKALAIPIDQFRDILRELKAQKFPIHARVLQIL